MNQKPNRLPYYFMIPFLVSIIAFASSCQKDVKNENTGQETNLTIKFTPVVKYDSVRMYFDTTTYTNVWNENFVVTSFKFYIRAIRLSNSNTGKAFEIAADKYFLVDFKDSLSTLVKVGILPSNYNRLSFILGVDSTHNVSGAQTDALDPAKGMFWAWNTGYIFAKFEGTSPSSTAPGKRFTYHIGGFKTGEDVNKEIQLLFPFGTGVNMEGGKSAEINVTADVYDWFSTPHDIRISKLNSIMTAGTEAKQVADNYSKMFTVMTAKTE